MPILYPDIIDEFKLNYGQLGLIRSITSFSVGFPQIFAGFFRRWLSGRVILSIGNIINSIMNIAISLGEGFLQFLGFSVIAGVGSSVQHPIGASIVSNSTEPGDRGRMLGLNQAFPSIAFTFTPILTAYMLTKMGWRTTLGFLSIPVLLLSLIILFFIKGSTEVEAKTSQALNLNGLKKSLQNNNVISISLLRSVMAFRMGVRTFLPLYFINILGFSKKHSSFLYSILLGGSIFGPIFWGWLSDRMNRKPLIIGIMACNAACYFLLNFITNSGGLSVLLFFIGFLTHAAVMQSIMTDSVERTQLEQIFGFYYTLGFTIGSFSSTIFGYIVEIYGFNIGFSYITAVSVISLIPAFFIQETRNLQ
jgi:FSR family fosmidomycin resistance protein-like MFS transporter